jgi:acetyl-CoA C-acetyltransferase
MVMENRVCIVGLGVVEPGGDTPGLSHKELLFHATRRALDDAGIEREHIGGAITASSDFLEGRSLSNQFTLDSIGGVMKPCDLRLAEDGMHAFFAGYMEVLVDPRLLMVVAAVQKPSERPGERNGFHKILTACLDPVYNRPVCNSVPHAESLEAVLAAMDARAYMNRSGVNEELLARVALKNINNAAAASGKPECTLEEVLASPELSWPMRDFTMAKERDAACTLILTSEKIAGKLKKEPVFISGVGWSSEGSQLAARAHGLSPDTQAAAHQAYRMAGIRRPLDEIDLAEVSDWYAHRELIHTEALGLCAPGETVSCIEHGVFERGGPIPVNLSGGLLGNGNSVITSGLLCVAEVARRIRGEADDAPRQEVRVGLAHSWGGFISPTAGVAVLSKW